MAEQVTLPLAFGAGLVSLVSPCVLPLIPAYVTYLTGSSLEAAATGEKRRLLLLNGLFFVLGFTIVFVLMGMSIGAIGRLLTEHMGVVRRIGGVVVIVFGLYMMGLLQMLTLDRDRPCRAGAHAGSAQLAPFGSDVFGRLDAVHRTGASQRSPSGGNDGHRLPKARCAAQLHGGDGAAVSGVDAFPGSDAVGAQELLPYTGRIRVASGALLVVLGIMIYTNSFMLLNSYFDWGF